MSGLVAAGVAVVAAWVADQIRSLALAVIGGGLLLCAVAFDHALSAVSDKADAD